MCSMEALSYLLQHEEYLAEASHLHCSNFITAGLCISSHGPSPFHLSASLCLSSLSSRHTAAFSKDHNWKNCLSQLFILFSCYQLFFLDQQTSKCLSCYLFSPSFLASYKIICSINSIFVKHYLFALKCLEGKIDCLSLDGEF